MGARPDPDAWNDLPDGFDNLAAYNLLSYKSAAEPFNAWALEELIGHYVTYRKLASLRAARAGARGADEPLAEPAGTYPLLPAQNFRRYAIATRQPRQLLRQLPTGTCCETACPGVYDLAVGALPVRLIVLDALARHPRNAPWGMFAHASGHARYGWTHYRPRSRIGVFLRDQLAKDFGLETDMAYTVEDFKREVIQDVMDDVLANPKHFEDTAGPPGGGGSVARARPGGATTRSRSRDHRSLAEATSPSRPLTADRAAGTRGSGRSPTRSISPSPMVSRDDDLRHRRARRSLGDAVDGQALAGDPGGPARPLVTFPDLPGGMADGTTILEAVENGHAAVQSWILTAREFGDPVPEPGDRSTLRSQNR